MPYYLYTKNLESYNKKLILANSYFTSKAIKASMGIAAKVLYPPVPNAVFEKASTTQTIHRENLVVTIARFGVGKVELVPEIAHLTDKRIKFCLIGLAHDLNVVQEVKRRIKKLNLEGRVIIITNASRQDIKAFLDRSKIYLHTMKMEHFGISIAEAMARGCLPVVHDSGGAPEFVPDEYRYRTPQEAAKIIEQEISEWTPEKAEKMMNIAERFSEKNFAKRFIELFEEFCDSVFTHQ